jgi:DNA modification methylase
MQTLNGEKQALWKAWRRKNQSEWQTALECRAIGQHWNNIKAIIKARRKAGERITVAQWSEANAPVTHRWLDEFSGFADRWEEFRAAWKWAQTSPYLPERRPGLHGFVDLINTKAKLEHVRGERALHRSERRGPVNADIQIVQGDCLVILRNLPSQSIQTCVTSPPYFQLRDYRTANWIGGNAQCDHRKLTKEPTAKSLATPHLQGTRHRVRRHHDARAASCSKCGATRVDDQIGQEETPEQYVARLVEVFREVRRVLRDDGTLWLNIGDTHSNRTKIRKSSHHTFSEASWKDTASRTSISSGDIKEKDLLLVPAMVALALRADGWYLRSDIIWHKASHLPESVRDRPTACYEHVFLLSKSKTYYYDSESIAEECASSSELSDKKNARDVWVIAPKPCTLAHFAVMPLDLAERCVKAGSSQYGCCSACDAPWIRQMERTSVQRADFKGSRFDTGKTGSRDGGDRTQTGARYVMRSAGWAPSCKCNGDNPVPCKVLDPFAGAGTTGLAALRHGCDAVLIELGSEYCKIMEKRLAGEAIGTFG